MADNAIPDLMQHVTISANPKSGGGIMTRIKTSIALMTLAAGVAACGSTATASPKTLPLP